MDKKRAFMLSFIITLIIFFDFYLLGKLVFQDDRNEIFITRVIDGDTISTKDGESIRLANINTPEKNRPGYNEAKEFLMNIENNSVQFEFISNDKYGRSLGRVYYQGVYLNEEIVKKGFATKFLVAESELRDFKEAEDFAVNNQKGLWKKSIHFGCFDMNIIYEKELVKIINLCDSINLSGWILRDESRKEYKFKNIYFSTIQIHSGKGKDNSTDLFWGSSQDIWNNDRDTIYLIDSESKLAYHKDYGY